MEKRKVIFDCDTGTDDAVALIAALKSDNLDVIGITSVRGNIEVDKVVENNLRILDLLGMDVPVYRGCHRAMARTLIPGRENNTRMQTVSKEVDGKVLRIHDDELPLPQAMGKVRKEHACSFIVDTLLGSDEKIDIIAVGPLTNLGVAFTMDMRITDHIGTIYIMGGALATGNRTPVAEANFYDDPEAAEIVLTSGCNVIVNGIEPNLEGATYDVGELAELRKIGTKEACFVSDMLIGRINKCKILFDTDSESCCIHDYAAVSQAIDPLTVTEMKPEICHVDISGGMSDGMLVVDRRIPQPVDSSIQVVYHMDTERTHALLRELLAK